MSVHVKLFDGSSRDWDAFVGSHPEGTFFHQYGWLQLVREVYGGEPFYLAAYDGEGLVGVLPLMRRWVIGPGRRLVSVPFADEGGLLVTSPDAEAALLEAAASLGRDEKVSYVELRQMRQLTAQGPVCDTSRVVMRMPIPDGGADALWDGFSKNMRKKIRRAGRDGLVASEGGAEDIPEFYRVYCRNMRDLGSPMHRRGFFEAIGPRFPGQTRVAVVRSKGETAGAAFAVVFGRTMTVLCAHSLRAYHSSMPNNLVYWQLFQMCAEQGLSTADFGRSPRGTGIYEFKKLWGMEEFQVYDSFLPVRGAAPSGERRESAAYAVFSRIWRLTPTGIAAAVGPQVFSRIPL